MGATSTEVKQNWENRNYNKYLVRLRKDIDAESIAYIEARKENGEKTSEIFREAIEALMEKENPSA